MRSLALLAFVLVACDGGGGDRQPPAPVSGWELGPTIDGKQYSKGWVTGNVITVRDVHYVTKRSGPLSSRISVGFNLSAPLTGTVPEKDPTACTPPRPATATLYFQAKGDDWLEHGKRWWAKSATVKLDHAGDYTMSAPLLPSAWGSTGESGDFAKALANVERVGFTIGNCEGYGHGGTGPATLTITSFEAS
jgi:hypothetical protein